MAGTDSRGVARMLVLILAAGSAFAASALAADTGTQAAARVTVY